MRSSVHYGRSDLLNRFDQSHLLLFIVFVLPGFISLRIWSLIVPRTERTLKDELLDAFGFGLLNAVIAVPLFGSIAPDQKWLAYALAVLAFILLPALWPFLIDWILRLLQAVNVIPLQSHNAWDGLFLRRDPYFMIIHFDDGRRIGAYYGSQSIASLYPNSGYIYVEKLWYLDEHGKFVSEIPDSKGIVLRPNDYKFIEFLAAEVPATHGEGDAERQ